MISFWSPDPDEIQEESILCGKHSRGHAIFRRYNGSVIASGCNLRIDDVGIDQIGERVAVPREILPNTGDSLEQVHLQSIEDCYVAVVQLDSREMVFFLYRSKEELFQRGDRLALGLIDDEILVGKNQTHHRKFVFNDPALLVCLLPDNRRWKPYYNPVLLLILGSFLIGCVLMAPAVGHQFNSWEFRSGWIACTILSFIVFFLGPIAMLVRGIRKDNATAALERRELIERLKSVVEEF
jgi:hypothetical protein